MKGMFGIVLLNSTTYRLCVLKEQERPWNQTETGMWKGGLNHGYLPRTSRCLTCVVPRSPRWVDQIYALLGLSSSRLEYPPKQAVKNEWGWWSPCFTLLVKVTLIPNHSHSHCDFCHRNSVTVSHCHKQGLWAQSVTSSASLVALCNITPMVICYLNRGVHAHETGAKLSQIWKPQLSEIWKVLAKLCENWQFCLVLQCHWNSQTPSELDLQIHNLDLSFLKSAHGSPALMEKNCTVLGWIFTLLSSLCCHHGWLWCQTYSDLQNCWHVSHLCCTWWIPPCRETVSKWNKVHWKGLLLCFWTNYKPHNNIVFWWR